jgi:hypothetical protein
MLLELVTWTEENILSTGATTFDECRATTTSITSISNYSSHLLIFEIDHMRDRKRYLNNLKSWVRDLALCGRLVTGQRRILLALTADAAEPLREFEKRLRASKVDVDSRGRPCKERMAKVLCLVIWEAMMQPENSFEVTDCDDLRAELERLGLAEPFDKSVRP